MIVYFTPVLNGSVVDLGQTGGAVDAIEFFPSPNLAVDSDVAARLEGATQLTGGRYAFTIPNTFLPEGRFWSRVEWRVDGFADPTYTTFQTFDFPVDNPPVVLPEDLATALGFVLPMSALMRAQLAESIEDGVAVVEMAIGSITPKLLTLTGATLTPGDNPANPAAWFFDTRNIVIVSWVVNTDGTYDVTYLYGFNGGAEQPIKRFILRYAASWWRKAYGNDPAFGQVVSSLSTDGQSVSYSSKSGSDVDPGVGMTLEALVARYGGRDSVKVFQRRNQYYGRDQTFWAGDGYYWPDLWG